MLEELTPGNLARLKVMFRARNKVNGENSVSPALLLVKCRKIYQCFGVIL